MRALVRVEDLRAVALRDPFFDSALQKLESSVIDTRELSTRRVAQSITAAKTLAEFDTATGSVHAGRVSHVGARAELKEVVDDCVQLVGLLDGLNLIRYQDDSQLRAAWESARTVVGSGRVNGNGNGTAPADPAPSTATQAPPPVM